MHDSIFVPTELCSDHAAAFAKLDFVSAEEQSAATCISGSTSEINSVIASLGNNMV